MTYAEITLEFTKIILSTQVVAGAVAFTFLFVFREDIKALILRIAKIRLPGGTEVSTPQAAKLEDATDDKPLPKPPPQDAVSLPLPDSLNQEELEEVRSLFDAERARAYLWEYRYLNYFLALQTQHVLDWLASLPTRTSLMLFDTVWLPAIPSVEERRAIIDALQAHYLVQILNGLIEITPKGREYIQWRGPLPDEEKA
ncbi:MAG: hypothetical protein WCG66_00750 [bacterium]